MWCSVCVRREDLFGTFWPVKFVTSNNKSDGRVDGILEQFRSLDNKPIAAT